MSTPHSGPPPAFAQSEDPGATPPQSRGLAVTLLVVLILAVLALAAWLTWYLLRDSVELGEFEAAPECGIGETETLEESVPGYESEIEETVGTGQDPFGAGWQCRWATPEGAGASVPSAATLVLVAAPVEGGVETAAETLRSTAGENDTQPVEGLGDEALTWVEDGAFEVGCVGVRVSNLYVESCYTAATDYDAIGSMDGEAAAEEAELLARAVVDELPAPADD
ncbi:MULTISPECIES: hypothetical protein [unclassified Nocardiopsis]|uniref:hypothetical protein n=1 Tax=unclassified Nocardiopsis TaxID=2649073 RepID=UPI0009E3907E|nr:MULTISPECIES: hypothetical protein [unclassified Nocardiopsis]MBQ1080472.1 hypothetical protein [Nocardiopsis sp. B62]